eukprot:2860716-Amphidinium_carterae.1
MINNCEQSLAIVNNRLRVALHLVDSQATSQNGARGIVLEQPDQSGINNAKVLAWGRVSLDSEEVKGRRFQEGTLCMPSWRESQHNRCPFHKDTNNS